jgi:nucleotide-binding universal stress UspA family protein
MNAVLGSSKILWALDMDSPDHGEDLRWLVDRPRPLPFDVEPVLMREGSSRKQTVDRLLKYAKRIGADVIAIRARHARSWHGILNGSLADALLLRSDLPILTLPEGAGDPWGNDFGRVLFPTDFSDESHEAFLALLPLAAATHSSILLWYKCEYVVPETFQAIHAIPAYNQFLQDDIQEHEASAVFWKAEGAQFGVPIECLVDEQPGYLEPAILRAAERYGANLIAVSGHPRHLPALVFGSVPLDLTHDAHSPVWVFPTGAQARRERMHSLA